MNAVDVAETSSGKDEASRRKSVIVYSNELLPYSETFIYEQARALKSWTPLLLGEKASMLGLDLTPLHHQVLENPQTSWWLRSACRRLRRIGMPDPRGVTMARSFGASLVHAHFGTSAVEIAPLARHLKLPMVVTLHGYDVTIRRDWWEAGNAGSRARRYPEKLLRLASREDVTFLAVSQSILEAAVGFGLPRHKIKVRYIGVDTTRFRPAAPPLVSRPKRILFVGRFVEKKGVAYLIQAFASVREEIPDAELVLAGDGPLRRELECLAKKMDVPVKFLGVCNNDQVRCLMESSRLLCLPSISASNGDSEGLPMVIMEAQACGLPVITSATGGRDEGISNGVTGISFPERNVAALSNCLIALLRNDDVLSAYGAAARTHAISNFDLDRCTLALEESYNVACGFRQ